MAARKINFKEMSPKEIQELDFCLRANKKANCMYNIVINKEKIALYPDNDGCYIVKKSGDDAIFYRKEKDILIWCSSTFEDGYLEMPITISNIYNAILNETKEAEIFEIYVRELDAKTGKEVRK